MSGILNDLEIIQLNQPASREVFARGLKDAMRHSVSQAATNTKGIFGSRDLFKHPFFKEFDIPGSNLGFNRILGWPIVERCRTNDFSDEDLKDLNLSDFNAVFERLYPLYVERFRPMITPFKPELLREQNARKIISMGLTSFGYDVSLDRNFKLFTNINSTIVDPKRLDERCLVDAEVLEDLDGAEYVIMPPNSYILGNTNEYFDMPRDIIAVCLGKCLTGDTLVTDASNGNLVRMDAAPDLKQILAMDQFTSKIRSFDTDGVIYNGTLPVFELTTATGFKIKATGTHLFKKWNSWTPLNQLSSGDRIAVARTEPFIGIGKMLPQEARLLGYMTADGQCQTPTSSPTFTKFEDTVMDAFIQDAKAFGFECSLTNRRAVRLVNTIGRGGIAERNRANVWLESHNLNVRSRNKSIPAAILTGDQDVVRNYLMALFTCDGSIQFRGEEHTTAVLEYYTTSDVLAEQLRTLLRRMGLFFTHRRTNKKLGGKYFPLNTLRTSDPLMIRTFAETIGFLDGCLKNKLLLEWTSLNIGRVKSNFDTLPKEAWSNISSVLKRLGCSFTQLGISINYDQSVPLQRLQEYATKIGDVELTALVFPDVVWDTVKTIKYVGVEHVYDFCVPGPSNFVGNGIIAHNSTYARVGAIVNVTPIEPGFKGTVVIEISNATSLPMKVYVNEGISQFLFFKGSGPCKTSYEDRAGKYQGQTGVRLPEV